MKKNMIFIEKRTKNDGVAMVDCVGIKTYKLDKRFNWGNSVYGEFVALSNRNKLKRIKQ